MKRIILFLTLFACFADVTSQSLLWEVSGKGFNGKSYLFGTIHLTCSKDMNISQQLNSAFDNTDQLVLELDMDDPNFMSEMQNASMNAGMHNFSSEMSPSDRKIVNEFLNKHFGGGLAQFGVMKPFIIQGLVLTKMLSCPVISSYEGELVKISKSQKEEIYGLETVQEQMKVFDSVPVKEQIKWLVESVRDFDKTKESFSKLLKAYKNADLKAITSLVEESPEMKDFSKVLLDDRNKKWIPKIEEFSRNKPTIYGFGAGHLSGENGVIELLRAKGYTVKAVR